jgi:hypothetical protein
VFTRIDHLMICVPDLERGMQAYTRLGFSIHPGGVHAGKGTHNAIAFNDADYLELLAIRDAEEYRRNSPYGGLVDFIGRGGGLRYLIVQSDALAADVAALRARGWEVGDPVDGQRRTPAGTELRWKAAMLGERNPLPVFFIQHLTPLAERRAQSPGAGRHPNGVLGAERVYLAVPNLAAAAETYGRLLGLPVPRAERGTVIHADMAVFPLGPAGLVLAQPAGPGATADALEQRGPGPFQVLYRTRSMDAAARWMAEHGLPAPARGIRNTGEQAMLVSPEHACGVSVGFVGPA